MLLTAYLSQKLSDEKMPNYMMGIAFMQRTSAWSTPIRMGCVPGIIITVNL